MDPQEIFRLMMQGGGSPPTVPAATPSAAPSEVAAAKSNDDILKSLFLGSGGSTEGRPDPIGGVNHQGRALSALKQMMGAAAGGGGGAGK